MIIVVEYQWYILIVLKNRWSSLSTSNGENLGLWTFLSNKLPNVSDFWIEWVIFSSWLCNNDYKPRLLSCSLSLILEFYFLKLNTFPSSWIYLRLEFLMTSKFNWFITWLPILVCNAWDNYFLTPLRLSVIYVFIFAFLAVKLIAITYYY